MKVLINLPVYNEEKQLEKHTLILDRFLKKNLNYQYTIQIVDNASIDGTRKIGEKLKHKYKNIDYLYIPRKGRGFALKQAWTNKNYDIYSYMDLDLSTDINKFPKLIDMIVKDGYDISIGSRLSKESKVKRGIIRTVLSKGYNLLIKLFFKTSFPDAQCGFKAIKKAAFWKIAPEIKNDNWFFDTELLLIGERKYKLKIASVPVKWIDDKETTVKVGKTIKEDIKGLIRVYKYLSKNKK